MLATTYSKFLHVNRNLHLYFPLCYRPVLLFFCHFACSPLILLFHLRSLLVYKGPLCSKMAISWGKKGVAKTNFSGEFAPNPLSITLRSGAMVLQNFPARTAPAHNLLGHAPVSYFPTFKSSRLSPLVCSTFLFS